MLFRIFVSSTFGDLQAERDALQRAVFPRLRTLCAEHGAELQVVDLRWGVSASAGLDHRTMRICLEELRRCREVTRRPNVVVLLGDRYGWRPAPWRIPADVFEPVRRRALETDPPLAGLLADWYRRDDNADPPEYLLLPRRGRFRGSADWSGVEARLASGLAGLAAQLGLAAGTGFGMSATEQEVDLALSGPLLPGQVSCFFRERAPAATSPGVPAPAAGDGSDPDPQARLDRFKAMLRERLPGAVRAYRVPAAGAGPGPDHLPELCVDAYAELAGAIRAELGCRPVVDRLQAEDDAHRAFAAARAASFVGRDAALAAIEEYVVSPSRSPFAVVGPGGVGKSALLARAAVDAAAMHPDTVVACRFVAATPGSVDQRLLLRDLCRQLARELDGDESAVPEAYDDLVPAFLDHLALARPWRPLIVFIDALDQLRGVDGLRGVPWIPVDLPPFARLIVSALPGLRERLSAAVPPDQLHELAPMTAAEGEELLAGWLATAGRRLRPRQRERVLERFAGHPYPLYLRLVFEQARGWTSFQRAQPVAEDTPAVITALVDRLSRADAHGPVLVRRSLGLIAAARDGLTEAELLAVLDDDRAVTADHRRRHPESPDLDGLPPIAWHRLYGDLAPYLVGREAPGGTVLSFFHRRFREQVERLLLDGDAGRQRHRALARFFADRPLQLAEGRPDLRKLAELPYQLCSAGLWGEAARNLTDLDFIQAKVAALGPDALLEDYDRLLAARPGSGTDPDGDALDHVRDAVRLSAHVLRRVPWQLPAQLLGRLQGVQQLPGVPAVLREARSRPGLRPVTPSLRSSGDPLVRTMTGHAAVVWQVAVDAGGDLAVSGGDDGALIVWDLGTGAELHRVTHRGRVLAVTLLPGTSRAVCAVDSSLLLYDIRRGECLAEVGPGAGWIRAVAGIDGRRVLFGADDGTVGCWTPEGGGWRRLGERRPSLVTALAVGPDGRRAVSATSADTLRSESAVTLWDLDTAGEVWTRSVPSGLIHGACLLPGGDRVAIACSSARVMLLRLTDGSPELVLRHENERMSVPWISGVAASPDGRRLASAGSDDVINLWELPSGKRLATLRGHHGTVRALAVAPDGRRLLSSSDDRTLRIWDLYRAERRPGPSSAHGGAVNALALTPAGDQVVSGSDDCLVKLWDAGTGSHVRTFEGRPSEIWDVAVTPDGRQVVGLANGNLVLVWDLESGRQLRQLRLVPPHRNFRRLLLTRDGSAFFHNGALFELRTGEILSRLPDGAMDVMAELADGRRVARGNGIPLGVWTPGAARAQVDLGTSCLDACVLPGGRLLTGSYDGTLTVVRLADGQVEKTLTGHRGRVDAVAASADGRLAASASGDGELKVWDVPTGREIDAFVADAPMLSCVMTADGMLSVAGDQLGNLHFLLFDG